jgi:hypothetical protein
MQNLITFDAAATAATIQATADRARDYRANAKAANTVAAFRSDWNDFTTWCRAQSFESLPAGPPTVALYITDLAERCKQRRVGPSAHCRFPSFAYAFSSSIVRSCGPNALTLWRSLAAQSRVFFCTVMAANILRTKAMA